MATKKKNRCWPGYEPVKGKKPHSQGSCRPEAESKLTRTEKTFRAKRRRQLDQWQEDHPGAGKSAAQHLGAPGAERKQGTGRNTKHNNSATKKKKGAKKKGRTSRQ